MVLFGFNGYHILLFAILKIFKTFKQESQQIIYWFILFFVLSKADSTVVVEMLFLPGNMFLSSVNK